MQRNGNTVYCWDSLVAHLVRASIVAQMAKKPPAVQETWVKSLDWEDSLEKGTATHSSILAWRIPWTIPWGQKEFEHD